METNMMRFYLIENVTSRHEGLCGAMPPIYHVFPADSKRVGIDRRQRRPPGEFEA